MLNKAKLTEMREKAYKKLNPDAQEFSELVRVDQPLMEVIIGYVADERKSKYVQSLQAMYLTAELDKDNLATVMAINNIMADHPEPGYLVREEDLQRTIKMLNTVED